MDEVIVRGDELNHARVGVLDEFLEILFVGIDHQLGRHFQEVCPHWQPAACRTVAGRTGTEEFLWDRCGIQGCANSARTAPAARQAERDTRLYLSVFTGIFGSPTWTRTRDLRINSPSLYQLSYQGIAYASPLL